MNRSMRNVVLLGLILLLGGLIGAGVTFGQGDRESLLQFGTEEVRLSEEVPADGISRLRAEAGSMDIELAAGASDDKIVATITGRASKKSLDKIKLELDPQGDELTVKGKEGGVFTFGFNIVNVTMRIEVPARKFEALQAELGSGDIDAQGVEAGELTFKTGSGDIELSGVKGGVISLRSGSGSIDGEGVVAEELAAKASSGNISLEDVLAALQLDAGSGNIRAEMDRLELPVTASSGSGNITLATRVAPASATVQYSVGSGRFRSDWNEDEDGERKSRELVFGDGQVQVKLSTGSGNISLREE
ncbi:DUF4097 family beta strand repeat-containing protein [Paenibacillus sp. B01]|uniref:DUF4097 family beta strand repeat-containing protein n=1 Tax=Paenibacillus sp. B01 TaxID=2660554 RepID=UPI00129B68DF|nr:DUF4097 family beta strand repeat-containing protein [Paenibacillus sp. B01]QGG54548.1 DUF4097 family beta strand repeat protein [Paenibacillus sp. B01]